jgi:CheY-like chemotaxis protein
MASCDERRRVLVVEDRDDVRATTVAVLEALGYVVLEAADAEVGFERARAERPDVILTDLELARSSGLELIARVRRELPPPAPPVIVHSGSQELGEAALAVGAVKFLPKPARAHDLARALAEVSGSLDEGHARLVEPLLELAVGGGGAR